MFLRRLVTSVRYHSVFGSMSRRSLSSDIPPVKKESIKEEIDVIKKSTSSWLEPTNPVVKEEIQDIEDVFEAPKAKRVKRGSVKPHNFEEYWSRLLLMRAEGGIAANAPVDTMGCAAVGDKSAKPEVYRFQTLVALMLSSQTKDAITAEAVSLLRNTLSGGLSIDSVADCDPEKFHECIRKVGFHTKKKEHIILAAQRCRDEFHGDIPNSVEGLCSLKGVGPKMAHLCMQAAWNEVTGIGVDVHVHRICNLWRWVDTKTPEETRKALESWLDFDKWSEINTLLVGLGQTVCPAIKPKCGLCALQDICPASSVKKK